MAQIGHKMQMCALQIAPIFRSIRPDQSYSQPKWILRVFKLILIVKITVLIVDSEKRAACALLVVCVVRVSANVDVVVLEQFVHVRMHPSIAIVLVRDVSDGVHEDRLIKFKAENEQVVGCAQLVLGRLVAGLIVDIGDVGARTCGRI